MNTDWLIEMSRELDAMVAERAQINHHAQTVASMGLASRIRLPQPSNLQCKTVKTPQPLPAHPETTSPVPKWNNYDSNLFGKSVDAFNTSTRNRLAARDKRLIQLQHMHDDTIKRNLQ